MAQLKKHSGVTIVLGAIMIILGLVAIVMPIAATFAIAVLLGWLLVIGGIMQFIFAFTTKGAGAFAWKLVTGIIAFIIGALLLANPIPSVLTLTLLLTTFLIICGIFSIITAFAVRPGKNWGWMLFGGIISVLLGWLIWSQWPISATWVIGLIAGLKILFVGFAMIATGMDSR